MASAAAPMSGVCTSPAPSWRSRRSPPGKEGLRTAGARRQLSPGAAGGRALESPRAPAVDELERRSAAVGDRLFDGGDDLRAPPRPPPRPPALERAAPRPD